jgi:hypothetical protein
MTNTVSTLEVCRELATQLAAFAALLLAASGIHKCIARQRTRAAAHEFAGVPTRWAALAAAVLAGAEVLASLLLWIPRFRASGAAVAGIIWGGYGLLMLRAVARGRRDVDCGCTFGAAHRPLGTFQLVRNAVLAASAALVAGVCATDGVRSIGAEQFLAAAALLALYGALDQAMALQAPRAGELL